MTWTVYLARCGDGTLYTGITTDLARRVAEHNSGCGGAYTRSRLPVSVEYSENVADRSRALQREDGLRRLSRRAKESLIARARGSKAERG